MAVDLHIGAVDTTLSAVDPAALRSPELIAAVVAAVKAELERDRLTEQRRTADRDPRVAWEL
ncbi:hypothetical protein AB0J83_44140 [Actinoplanes sp. NPDC049596]|uniref:hypothetical protein n=1 Tax=unclassified Actinoplanes TaxID=2626549 RepID=UPI003434C7A7